VPRRLALSLLLLATIAVGVAASLRLTRHDFPVSTNSTTAYEAYREGVALIERDQPTQALERFRAALAADDHFAMAWYQLYRAQIALNDRDAAGTSISAAFELRSSASDLERFQIEMGKALFDYDFDAYTRIGAELVEQFPDDPAALRYQASRARRERDYDTALRCLERILVVDPERVESHQEIAQICLWKGDYECAINSLERYVFYAPQHAKSYDRLGTALLLTGQFDDAEENFRIALEQDPSFLSSVQGLVMTFVNTGQLRRARELIQKFAPAFAERREASTLDVLDWTIDFVSHDWNSLIEGTQKHLPLPDRIDDVDPDFPVTVHLLRSIAFAETGDLAQSEAEAGSMRREIDRLFTRYPKTADSHDAIRLLNGMVGLRLAPIHGDEDAAIAAMREAIDESGFSPHNLAEHRTELARAYLRRGEAQKALQEAQIVLERIPNNPDMLWIAAQACMASGDEDQAAVVLRHYLDVMSKADQDHPDLVEAIALWRKIAPSM